MTKLKMDFKKSARPHHPPQCHIAAFHHAARTDDLETVLAFIQRYPDAVDIKDQSARKYDVTAMQLSSRNGHIRIMQALRDAGSNLNQQDGMGWTPLMQTILSDNVAAVHFMLESGVDTKIKNSAKWDAARLAKENLGTNHGRNHKKQMINLIKEYQRTEKKRAAALKLQPSPI